MERSEMSSPAYTSLSHDTERSFKTKTTNLHWTPPLIMHSVVARARSRVVASSIRQSKIETYRCSSQWQYHK
jgi:hypothetical protein